MKRPAARWYNSPLVVCSLLPREIADDPAAINRQMAKDGRPGAWELMPVMDPRFKEAVDATIDGLLQSHVQFTIEDRKLGKLAVALPSRPNKLQVRFVRVLFLRGPAALAGNEVGRDGQA